MKFEAMNTQALAAVVNSMRPVTAAFLPVGYMNQKVRTMLATGKLTPAEAAEDSARLNLSREGVIKVLLSFKAYGVSDRVQQAVGVVPHEIAGALAPAHAAPVQTHGPVVVTRVAELPTLNIVETDGVQTMSSLDMVAYINATRTSGQAEVRHDNFMAKVPNVLGYEAAPKFLGTAFYTVNNATRTKPVYNLPRREAMLMAMSYSYKLQATVYDAWQAAEAKAAPAAPVPVLGLIPNFDDPIEAAEAWIAQRKQANVLKLELVTASEALTEAQPKVAFHDAVVADNTVHSLGDAGKLLGGIGRTAFIEWLRENKYIQADRVPYQRHINAGILASSFAPNFVTASGKVVPKTTYVTSKGLTYFQPKIASLLKEKAK